MFSQRHSFFSFFQGIVRSTVFSFCALVFFVSYAWGQGERVFSLKTVAKHDNRDSCWIVIEAKVYDVTTFIARHPGGIPHLVKVCGTDATQVFLTRPMGSHTAHSASARSMMSAFLMGTLGEKGSTSVPSKASNTSHWPSRFLACPLQTSGVPLARVMPHRRLSFYLHHSFSKPDTKVSGEKMRPSVGLGVTLGLFDLFDIELGFRSRFGIAGAIRFSLLEQFGKRSFKNGAMIIGSKAPLSLTTRAGVVMGIGSELPKEEKTGVIAEVAISRRILGRKLELTLAPSMTFLPKAQSLFRVQLGNSVILRPSTHFSFFVETTLIMPVGRSFSLSWATGMLIYSAAHIFSIELSGSLDPKNRSSFFPMASQVMKPFGVSFKIRRDFGL